MHPNKLLFVIDRIIQPGAGTEGQLLLLMNHLHWRGVALELLVLNSSPWLARAELPWPVTSLGSASVKNPGTWYRLWRLARQWRAKDFRLAQVFFNDASLLCPPVFAACGIKTVIARRDMGFWYTGLHRYLLPLTGRFVTAAVANSQAVGEVTRTVEKLPHKKIHVIYNGYNAERHAVPPSLAGQPELAKLRAEGARMVGLVANVRPIKRIEDAVAAVAKLSPEYPDLHLVVLGGGAPDHLIALAKSLGVQEKVHFLGSRSDISACLSYFEAGLLCSESEGFSNAIVEYQYAGLPVVCSHTGGNPEAVTHGETGWLYPVGDVEALKQHLGRLLADPEKSHSMGWKGREQAQARYLPEAMTDRYLELYRGIVPA